MLMLGRQNGESIEIGDNVRVLIDRCKDGKCRVGIDAPPHIKIVRSEIAERYRNTNNADD